MGCQRWDESQTIGWIMPAPEKSSYVNFVVTCRDIIPYIFNIPATDFHDTLTGICSFPFISIPDLRRTTCNIWSTIHWQWYRNGRSHWLLAPAHIAIWSEVYFSKNHFRPWLDFVGRQLRVPDAVHAKLANGNPFHHPFNHFCPLTIHQCAV